MLYILLDLYQQEIVWCLYSDQVHAWLISEFGLSINTSAQSSITRHFLWPALIKIPSKLLCTVSCESQVISAWSKSKSLLSTLIHVVKILDESVGETQICRQYLR